MVLYHGTDKKSFASIKENGFKCGECSDYGSAVYFSDDLSVANQYGSVIIEAIFSGKLLDLQIPNHFEIYKQYPNREILKLGYDGLKDNFIVAIYNTQRLSIQFKR